MARRSDRSEVIREVLGRAIRLHEQVMRMDPSPILAAADAIAATLREGGKVLVFGNGGSASDSQHFAAELVGRFQQERRGLAAMALTADASVLTSIANDYGYEQVFARQIQALGRPGDVAFGISTSGASPNVVAGLKAARRADLRVAALTGRDGGLMGSCAEIHINIPHASTPRIQEVHRTVLHIICELVEGQVPTGSGSGT